MYYVLLDNVENDEEDAILEGKFGNDELAEFSFNTGLSIRKCKFDIPVRFTFDEFALRGTMTDFLSVDEVRGPVFSATTQDLFHKLGINCIEYFQMILVDEFPESHAEAKDKKKVIEYADYFIGNVVGLVDCVDHHKSVLEYFYPEEIRQDEGGHTANDDDANNPFAGENLNEIDFITHLVLDESKIDPSLKIFRLKDKPDLVVFHEDVVNEIRKEKLTGFVFVPVDQYTDAIPDDDEPEQREEENAPEQQPASLPKSEPKPEPQGPPPTELKPITEPRQPLEEAGEKKKPRSRFFID